MPSNVRSSTRLIRLEQAESKYQTAQISDISAAMRCLSLTLLYNMHWRVRRGTLLAMPARSSRFQERPLLYNSRFVFTRGVTRCWFNSPVAKHCDIRYLSTGEMATNKGVLIVTRQPIIHRMKHKTRIILSIMLCDMRTRHHALFKQK
jgi:hypothetical protein